MTMRAHVGTSRPRAPPEEIATKGRTAEGEDDGERERDMLESRRLVIAPPTHPRARPLGGVALGRVDGWPAVFSQQRWGGAALRPSGRRVCCPGLRSPRGDHGRGGPPQRQSACGSTSWPFWGLRCAGLGGARASRRSREHREQGGGQPGCCPAPPPGGVRPEDREEPPPGHQKSRSLSGFISGRRPARRPMPPPRRRAEDLARQRATWAG